MEQIRGLFESNVETLRVLIARKDKVEGSDEFRAGFEFGLMSAIMASESTISQIDETVNSPIKLDL